jgi:hypothetical protein
LRTNTCKCPPDDQHVGLKYTPCLSEPCFRHACTHAPWFCTAEMPACAPPSSTPLRKLCRLYRACLLILVAVASDFAVSSLPRRLCHCRAHHLWCATANIHACTHFFYFFSLAGYVSGRLYKQLGGTNWVSNVLLTSVIFCGPLVLVFSYLNIVAILYRVSSACEM